MSADTLDCPGGSPSRALPLLTVACAVLVDADGRILVTDRPPGKDMAGLWEFPGGKVEPLESPEAALVRELHEELGLETVTSCLAPCGFASHAYEKVNLLLLAYAIRKWRGTPTAREGQRMQWVRVNDLFHLPMPPADKPLIGQIAAIL
ncbi:(deoxy)nucleoside triphosphate pyrophosphohydrolase [Sandaracinobacter sp. RS1-74]|uniref:(deoxy)nucleoside triphosphate pyrophosphohydrolase n=1 Tax=Sandaracinobacteroides sayramensis TaxID=2913411 RepID=UPI001EDB4CBA|nr:(deoxy)nucleoside triphosphate pyrophosphohydrolase [Sandaracinobacteroides sayramensis]MCG2840751.1 (deoxy)nucleoside triphosphate pyrophosphohydrolase [Sandaracinobacteroides sayramensis]